MIVTVANQKGGSGKTTSAAAIATGATYRGLRALAVDLDAQSNLTFVMGGDVTRPGAYELLTGKGKAADIVQRTDQGDLIAASVDLAALDSILTGDARVYALQRAVKPIRGFYDVIVIDTPPTLGTPLINALAASDGVVITLRAKMVNLQGLYLLAQTIRTAQQEYNPRLRIMGALLTEHNGRTIAARNVADTIRESAAALEIPMFESEIRQGVAIDEAQIMQESLFEYAPKSNPAQDYLHFLDEIGIRSN